MGKAAIGAALLLILTGPALAEPIRADQIKVSDGDTIRAHGERYRLVGYDTPETWSRRRVVTPEERALGKRARDRFKVLLKSGPLDLTEVPCACTKHTTIDKRGRCRTNDRLCAVLTVNGRNIGDDLIEKGLAETYVCAPTECPPLPNWPKIIEERVR